MAEQTPFETLPPEVAEAHSLAARMPSLLIKAQRVAHTVTYGTHGRRRAGPGETFWQFRHFDENDSRTAIDWRRSAASDHLFVREREWEAAHTIWLWVDLSPSMQFRSSLSETYKDSRAVVLALALCELLVRGGERVGLMGHAPITGRHATRRIAEIMVSEAASARSLPPPAALNRFSECVLFSDFLEPVPETAAVIEAIAGQDVRGHLVQIFDPAEETLPYEGRTEFAASESSDRVIAGRAETLRDAYAERLRSHRASLANLTDRLGWSFFLHHTDRPAGEALLAIHNRLAGLEQNYRSRSQSQTADAGIGQEP